MSRHEHLDLVGALARGGSPGEVGVHLPDEDLVGESGDATLMRWPPL
jgi:hypothetical protein